MSPKVWEEPGARGPFLACRVCVPAPRWGPAPGMPGPLAPRGSAPTRAAPPTAPPGSPPCLADPRRICGVRLFVGPGLPWPPYAPYAPAHPRPGPTPPPLCFAPYNCVSIA